MIELLSWNDLMYKYDETHELTFPDGSISRGDQLAVLGASGSGKSTWLQLIAGILPIQHGEVHYGKQQLSGVNRSERDRIRAAHLGLVFQKNHFLENLSVSDNLALPSFARKRPVKKDLIAELCEQLSVQHLLNKMPKECSVGELQRLSIVRTMSTEPSFILADEPTSALDDRNTQSILDVFDALRSTRNVGIVIVTHDQRVKAQISEVISF